MIGDRVSVTHLTKRCPLFLHLSTLYPMQDNVSLEAEYGTFLHAMLEELVHNPDTDIEDLIKDKSDVSVFSNALSKDPVFASEIRRMLKNARLYIKTTRMHTFFPETEKKIEYSLQVGDTAITIVGVIDILYHTERETVIADWKTGGYPAPEHHKQLEYYAFLLHALGELDDFPVVIRDIYLGVDGIKTVEGKVYREDLPRIETEIKETLLKAIHSPKPAPSDACLFCPYKFRCPLYYRLNKERFLIEQEQNIKARHTKISIIRKLASELKKLSILYYKKAEELEQYSKQQNKDLKRQAQTVSAELIEERVWYEEIAKVLPDMSPDEITDLLVRLLHSKGTIAKKELPPSVWHRVKSFTSIKR